jgi:hypothetical protein
MQNDMIKLINFPIFRTQTKLIKLDQVDQVDPPLISPCSARANEASALDHGSDARNGSHQRIFSTHIGVTSAKLDRCHLGPIGSRTMAISSILYITTKKRLE